MCVHQFMLESIQGPDRPGKMVPFSIELGQKSIGNRYKPPQQGKEWRCANAHNKENC